MPDKSYILSGTDFQDRMRAFAEAKGEVHRLDCETDRQFNQRIEIVVARLKEKGRAEFDNPTFRTIIYHSPTMATITVEVVYGERREDEDEKEA